MPLEPGEWKIVTPVNGPGFHVESFALDIDDGNKLVNVLAASSGVVSRVRSNVCAGGKDICRLCSVADTKLADIAVQYDKAVHTTFNDLGNYVMIDHPGGYRTVYAHLACDTVAVKEGDQVKSGDILGRVGTSGASTGTHLHFEVRFKVGAKYEVSTSIEELQSVTMEGILLSAFQDETVYTSTNRPGLEFAEFTLQGAPPVYQGDGTYAVDIQWGVRNNAEEARRLETVKLWGQADGRQKTLLATVPVGQDISSGSTEEQVIPVTIEIPDRFVGYYSVSATYLGDEQREIVGNLTDRVLCVADERSRLVDDSSPDFFFNREDGFNEVFSGGADGGGVKYTFSNEPNLFGTWKPNGLQPGRYEIMVYVPSKQARSPSVTYRVLAGDGEPGSTRLVDYSLQVSQLDNFGRWISLGRHFLDGTHHEVTMEPIPQGSSYRVGYDSVLFRYSGESDDFEDVDAQDWFYCPVNQLQNLGIVKGRQTPDGVRFEPSSQVTRAEMLKIAMEAATYRGRSWFMLIEAVPEEELSAYFSLAYTFKGLEYPPFTDIEDHWAQWYIELAVLAGIVSPAQNRLFRPDDAAQRIEAAKILVEAFGYETSSAGSHPLPYTDIDFGEWYVPYIRFLDKHEVIRGYPDGTLKPDQPVNRAEAATLVSRIFARDDAM